MIICNYSHKLHLGHWSLKEDEKKTQGSVFGVFFLLLNWPSRLEKHPQTKLALIFNAHESPSAQEFTKLLSDFFFSLTV